MTVSAVIPSWNRRALLERLLSGLRNQTMQPAEILVVDNGSTDGAPEAAEAAGARVIRLERNRGFAHAVNRGVADARGDAVAVLNNDVELTPQWLERLAAPLGDAGVWFCCGKLLMASNPSLLDGSYDLISRAGCPWRAGWGRPADLPAFAEPRMIALAPMTAALFRRELFSRAGALDERFESYLEDVDFGLRCAVLGLAGRYVPDAIATHQGSATLGRWHPETVRLLARNMAWLVDKHYPPDLRFRWRRPIAAGQRLWGAIALRHGAFANWRAGRREALESPLPFIGGPAIEGILCEQERHLFELQHTTGWDAYWRVYSVLAGEL